MRNFLLSANFRGMLGVLISLGLWEFFAKSGLYSEAMTPPLMTIWIQFKNMVTEGTVFIHAAHSLLRVIIGLSIALAISIPVGIMMGYFTKVEKLLFPLLNFLMPIPSLAWVPLFILWFGINDVTTILVVIYATLFTLMYNTWSGVKAVNPVWEKSATVMGAKSQQIFWKIFLPAVSPYIISSLRISFGRAWIAVIGGELLSAPEYGLGKIIFDAREFLETDKMLSALFIIGCIGILVEKLILKKLEINTIERWGMSTRKNL